jgi:hypothetical protein
MRKHYVGKELSLYDRQMFHTVHSAHPSRIKILQLQNNHTYEYGKKEKLSDFYAS